MLIHLNLVNEESAIFKEYEQDKFCYFRDINTKNIQNPQENNEETKKEIDLHKIIKPSQTVDYIFIVGFDHKIGSVIEYFYPDPNPTVLNENSKRALCFIGLPDGSHVTESDYSFFILPDLNGDLYYGVSCFRQIKSWELEVKDDKVSRSFVQKSVCVLSRTPLFGTLMIKLLPTTHAFFNQKNFSDTKILEEFYNSTNQVGSKQIKYSDFYTGFDMKRIVIYWKQNILSILKLILMEGKIMIYSTKASKVSTFVLTLLSLLPGAVNLNSEENEKIQKVLSHFKDYGLPLKLFNSRCVLLPLSTLDDLDLLSECKGFLVGCTNQLLMQYPKIKLDWVLNLDDGTTEYRKTDLWKIAKAITSTEKHFINSLVKELKQISSDLDSSQMNNWDSTDQENIPGIESLDHADLRAKNAFSTYFKQMLWRMAYAELCAKRQECPSPEPELISQEEIDGIELKREIKKDEIDDKFLIEIKEEENDTVNSKKETENKFVEISLEKDQNLEKEKKISEKVDKK